MTRNILDLTKKPSLSSNNLLATNPSLNSTSTNSSLNRPRKPLPIIEPTTGKEIVLESDPAQSNFKNVQPVPPQFLYMTPSQSSMFPPTKNMRKPLPIINPKTGEIVTNPVIPLTTKRAIPIINPKTGTELENLQERSHESQTPDQSPNHNNNIIRTPFTVMINRPPSMKRTPNVLHSSYPMQNGQILNYQNSKQSPIIQSEYPNNSIWSKSRQPHEWPIMSLTGSQSDSYSAYPSSEIEEEEEEAEFAKYDWNTCIGYGMSFFDDEEVVCQDHRILGRNGQVSVW